MRRAAFGLMVVLICVSAFAQNGTPQWRVVKAMKVTQNGASPGYKSLYTNDSWSISVYRIHGL